MFAENRVRDNLFEQLYGLRAHSPVDSGDQVWRADSAMKSIQEPCFFDGDWCKEAIYTTEQLLWYMV